MRDGAVGALVLIVATTLSIPFDGEAQCTLAGHQVTAPDASPEDHFGSAVDTDGVYAAVGAPDQDAEGDEAGSVYLYHLEGNRWTFEEQLYASDRSPGDRFGSGVALAGDWLAVGAPVALLSRGAVYLFRREGGAWVWFTKLTASDGATDDRFGEQLSLDGNRLVVGVPERDELGGATGAAYVFAFNDSRWELETKLLPTNPNTGDRFGAAVEVDGARILIGAPGDNEIAPNAGAAYLFQLRDEVWSLAKKFLPSGPPAAVHDDRFGTDVAIDGDVALIGVPLDDDIIDVSGAVFSYREEGGAWIEEQKLIGHDTVPFDFFGTTVALSGSYALITAPHSDDTGISSGAVYVWRRGGNNWFEEFKFAPAAGGDLDTLGRAVALAGVTAIAGSRTHGSVAPEGGAAYFFPAFLNQDCNGDGTEDACELSADSDCNCNGILDECDIASGTSPDGNANGIPDSCERDCDGNGIFDGCDISLGNATDCNDNGVLDACEVAAGSGDDCDRNGIPDACELVSQSCLDCNSNGLLDGCDIANGRSMDTNTNGVPDECERDFVRGDTNGNGAIGLIDALASAEYLFVPGSTIPGCLSALDVNDDGELDLIDPLSLLLFLFAAGPEPPPPFLNCGRDAGAACLPCASSPHCP